MKRFFLILFLAAIALSGCDTPSEKPTKDTAPKAPSIESAPKTEAQPTMDPTTNTGELPSVVPETPTAESVSKKIEEVEASLKETQDLLVKRTAERDAYKAEFFQLVRGKGKAPEEIEQECMKKTSELEQFSWFSKAKTAWGNWKDVAKDIVVFTRQNARLEKSIQELKLVEAKLKRFEENRKVYIPGEDPELDKLIAGTEVHLEFEDYNKLSSTEQALIDEEVHKSMTETIKKTISIIPNLELKSIEELPALPDFAAMIDQPTDEVQQSMFKTVRNKCEAKIKAAQKEVNDFIENKQPELACDAWLKIVDELKEIVVAWGKIDDSGKNESKKYLDALKACSADTLRFMSKPYWDSLNEGVKSLESVDNQDWDKVIESLEGLVNIDPRLIPLMAKEMESPWKKISLQLKLGKELNDFEAEVIQQRLMNVIEKCPEEVKHHFPDIEETIRKTKAESLYKQAVELQEALTLDPGNSDYQKEKKTIESAIDPFSTEGRKAGDRVVKVINGVEFAFRWSPAGTFMMGSPTTEKDRSKDETQHQVTLTKGFWMMETEVTQKQWKAIMGTNPSNFKGDDLPVETVSWNDCQEFCKKCAQLGLPVQLPTEAQWEYACRAGTTGAYSGNLDEMAWYWDNSNKTTHSVGTKKPNAWGLYDMHGNVWEWCQDWKADYPSGSVTDPAGPWSGSKRVDRGGSWNSSALYCRSADRDDLEPVNRGRNLGFRCVKGQ